MFTGWLLRHWSTEEDSWGYVFTLIAFLYFIFTNYQLEFLIQAILKCYSIFTQYIIKVSSPLIRVIKHANFVSTGLSLELLSLSLYYMTYFSSLFLYCKANGSAPSSPKWNEGHFISVLHWLLVSLLDRTCAHCIGALYWRQ